MQADGSDDHTTQRSQEEQEQEQEQPARWSVYRDFSDGRRGPQHLSQARVRNRNVMVFAEERWAGEALEALLCAMDALHMRRVDTLSAAKFVVVDSATRLEEVLAQLAVEYQGGCHHIREVYAHHIFVELTHNATKRGIVFASDPDQYLMLSTLDISTPYLKRKGLWPLKAKQHHRCGHCRN